MMNESLTLIAFILIELIVIVQHFLGKLEFELLLAELQ